MTTNTQKPTELTPAAIELLRLLDKAASTGVPAISLDPGVMGSDYDSLITAELIEVRTVPMPNGRFRYQSLPHIFIRPAGIEVLRKLDQ